MLAKESAENHGRKNVTLPGSPSASGVNNTTTHNTARKLTPGEQRACRMRREKLRMLNWHLDERAITYL
jgi:hypothetical protein